MQHITIEDLDRWGACCREDGEDYCNARLKRLARGRKGLTGLEVSRMRSIPYEDRIWALLRREVLGDALEGVVETIVARAVRRHALSCPATSEWARRWLSGEDRSEAAARAEAWAAARAEANAARAEERQWQLGVIRRALRRSRALLGEE